MARRTPRPRSADLGAASEIDPVAPLRWIAEHRSELRKPVLITAGTLLLLNGFYVIPPDETGIVQRFGRKLQDYREPGLHYKLPWPVERLVRVQPISAPRVKSTRSPRFAGLPNIGANFENPCSSPLAPSFCSTDSMSFRRMKPALSSASGANSRTTANQDCTTSCHGPSNASSAFSRSRRRE